jgi:hypothetical protein
VLGAGSLAKAPAEKVTATKRKATAALFMLFPVLQYRATRPAQQAAVTITGEQLNWLRCLRVHLRPLSLNALKDFFTVDSDVLRHVDAEPDLIALYPENGDGNVVPDHQRLLHPCASE